MQAAIVQVKWMLGDFVLDYNHRRITAKTLNKFKPIFCIKFLSSLTPVKYKQI